MRIIQLTAENVKRLRAVDITPAEHLQVITGRNAQGKSSVLDAIWLALGGGDAKKSTPRPVRDGEERAEVTITLDDLIVTRTWAGEGRTTLKVTNTEGARYGSPQTVLDELVGRLSFDPLAFTQLSAKAQRDALLELVDLPFDPAALDAERAELYQARTITNRDAKELEGHIARMPGAPEDTPANEVSATDLIEEITRAHRNNAERRGIADNVERATEVVRGLEQQLVAARERLAEHQADLSAHPLPIDTTPLQRRLEEADEINANVRALKERQIAGERLRAKRARVERLTQQISVLDDTKAKGLAQARFPVNGLGFDDTGVTFQGVPLGQASSSERIRVSLAMAMALNPRLRVIRILDGSLLDRDSMALIEQMAAEHDYQVWVERVEDGTAAAVVIEDGEVAS